MFNLFKRKKKIPTLEMNTRKFNKDYPEFVVNPTFTGDYVTYGNCPNCNAVVSDDMYHTDKVCPNCGQKLAWSYKDL